MKKCPNCNSLIDDDCQFCTECGKPIPKVFSCPHCGSSLDSEDVYCPNCGNKVDEASMMEEEDLHHCPHCGVSLNDGDMYCSNCGKVTSPDSYEAQKVSNDEVDLNNNERLSESSDSVFTVTQAENIQVKKTSSFKIIVPVLLGLLILGIIAGGWFYMNSSQDYSQPAIVSSDSIIIEDESLDIQIKERLQAICDNALKYTGGDFDAFVESNFSAEFTELYKEVSYYDGKWAEEGSVGFFDFNFWTGGQDGDLTKMEVKQIEIKNEKEAIANVKYEISHGGTVESNYIESFRLLQENGKWVIDDLRNYKNDFKEYIDSSKEEWKNKEEGQNSDEEMAIGAFSVGGIEDEDVNKVYEEVEEMPEYPGGQRALLNYLKENTHYPEVAEDNGIQGKVIVTFVVDSDGSITDVEVVQPVEPSLDKEAIRVIKSMPRWKAGKLNGTPVRVQYRVPVMFKIQ